METVTETFVRSLVFYPSFILFYCYSATPLSACLNQRERHTRSCILYTYHSNIYIIIIYRRLPQYSSILNVNNCLLLITTINHRRLLLVNIYIYHYTINVQIFLLHTCILIILSYSRNKTVIVNEFRAMEV